MFEENTNIPLQDTLTHEIGHAIGVAASGIAAAVAMGKAASEFGLGTTIPTSAPVFWPEAIATGLSGTVVYDHTYKVIEPKIEHFLTGVCNGANDFVHGVSEIEQKAEQFFSDISDPSAEPSFFAGLASDSCSVVSGHNADDIPQGDFSTDASVTSDLSNSPADTILPPFTDSLLSFEDSSNSLLVQDHSSLFGM